MLVTSAIFSRGWAIHRVRVVDGATPRIVCVCGVCFSNHEMIPLIVPVNLHHQDTRAKQAFLVSNSSFKDRYRQEYFLPTEMARF